MKRGRCWGEDIDSRESGSDISADIWTSSFMLVRFSRIANHKIPDSDSSDWFESSDSSQQILLGQWMSGTIYGDRSYSCQSHSAPAIVNV